MAPPIMWPPSQTPNTLPVPRSSASPASARARDSLLIGPNERCRRSSSASRSSPARMGLIVRPRARSAKLFHDLVGDRVVRVHVLDLVGLLEHVDQVEDLLRGLLVQRYLDRRQERRLGRLV